MNRYMKKYHLSLGRVRGHGLTTADVEGEIMKVITHDQLQQADIKYLDKRIEALYNRY